MPFVDVEFSPSCLKPLTSCHEMSIRKNWIEINYSLYVYGHPFLCFWLHIVLLSYYQYKMCASEWILWFHSCVYCVCGIFMHKKEHYSIAITCDKQTSKQINKRKEEK